VLHRRRVVALVALVAVTSACSSGGDGPSATVATGSTPTSLAAPLDAAALQAALDRAVAWLAAELPDTDAFTLAFIDYVGRRHGIAEFANARSLAQQAAARERPDSQPDLRLVFPDARVSPASLDEPDTPPGFMLVRGGLACDEPGSPADFDEQIQAAIAAGGYDLTHAGIALGVERDLACTPTGGATLLAEVIDALDAEARSTTTIDDLAVERLAVLIYLGASDRVTDEQLAAIVEAQQPDGSIAAPDDGTARHLMAFVVWVLADAIADIDDSTETLVAPA
jgi:hypothetical protein